MRVKFSVETRSPILSAKQLRFSEYVFRLKFAEKTNASNSPNAKGSKIMSYASGSIFFGPIELVHISKASAPALCAEKPSSVLAQDAPMPLTGKPPVSESVFIVADMKVDSSEQSAPFVFIK